jgi:hypothetical protein
MQFSYIPRHDTSSAAEAATFRIERLWAHRTDGAMELSHLLDRSYDYHSPRELKWHLAERFGLPVHVVALRRH